VEGYERHEQRKQRIVKNEVSFAQYNERRKAFEEAASEPIPFVCECGDETCFMAVELLPHEWNAAHRREDQFVVVPDHIEPDLEAVVEQHAGYWVLRKFELPSTTLGP